MFVVRTYIAIQNLLLVMLSSGLFKSDLGVEPNRILVYRTARLGDFLVAIPALVVLRRRFPNAKIVVLTASSSVSAMQRVTDSYVDSNREFDLPWLSFVVPSLVDDAHVLLLADKKTALKQLQQIVIKLDPDMVFILPFSGEGALGRAKKLISLWLASVRCPVYGWRVRSDFSFMRDAQFAVGMVEHQVWGPLHAIAESPLVPEIKESEITFHVAIHPQSEEWTDEVWGRHGFEETEGVVAIFPGGTFPHKQWPVDKFVQICNSLHKEFGQPLVILGASTDRIICDELSRMLTIPHLNLAGQTDLSQLAAVLSRCCLYVGNDTGAAHLASAVGCPCVTLTSSIQHPGFWEPWNSREWTIRHDVPCHYCHSYTDCPLKTRLCIEGIEVSKVVSQCKMALASVGSLKERVT